MITIKQAKRYVVLYKQIETIYFLKEKNRERVGKFSDECDKFMKKIKNVNDKDLALQEYIPETKFYNDQLLLKEILNEQIKFYTNLTNWFSTLLTVDKTIEDVFQELKDKAKELKKEPTNKEKVEKILIELEGKIQYVVKQFEENNKVFDELKTIHDKLIVRHNSINELN